MLRFSSTTNRSVPGSGRPTGRGEYFSRTSRSIRTEVVATVVSVGPYMFQTSAPGNRSSKRRAVSGKRISPQKRKRRTRWSSARLNVRSTRHISANDGVETHVVTLEFASVRYSNFELATRSRLMLKSVPPVARLQYKSITDRSKENGA